MKCSSGAKLLRNLRLRVIGTPDMHVRILLAKLGIKLPNRPLFMQNVVDKMRV